MDKTKQVMRQNMIEAGNNGERLRIVLGQACPNLEWFLNPMSPSSILSCIAYLAAASFLSSHPSTVLEIDLQQMLTSIKGWT